MSQNKKWQGGMQVCLHIFYDTEYVVYTNQVLSNGYMGLLQPSGTSYIIMQVALTNPDGGGIKM